MKQRAVFTAKDILSSACGHLNPHLDTGNSKPAAKANKFHNKWTEIDGFKFQSEKEGKIYGQLKMRRKAGEIGQLELQKEFLLIEKVEEPIIGKRGLPLKRTTTIERETSYVADFCFIEAKTGEYVVMDCKSEVTRKLSTYIIKRKLMLSVHKITIKEV